MSTIDCFDYSWSRPDPSALARAGIKVVCRYLTGYGKAVSRAEIDALHAHGIGVVLNFEAGATNAANGAAQGVVDGRIARAAARALGAPANLPLVYSVDYDVPSWQIPTVLSYLHSTDDPANAARAYAKFSVIEAFGRPGWQTIGWSYGQISSHAVLYQSNTGKTFNGSSVDYNQIRDMANLGAWWPSGSPHATTPTPVSAPASPEEDDDMILILNGDTKGQAGFWLSGGKAMTSNSNVARTAHKNAGGKIESWPAAEFIRALQTWK